jgi:hypothetical protein
MSCDRNIVTFKWMLDGYTDAAARFDAAEKTHDPQGTYMALFETLNWAVALDERAGTHWLPDGKPLGWKWRQRLGHGAEIMGGVRFARNSVHHQWSDALQLAGGRMYPKRFAVHRFRRSRLENGTVRSRVDLLDALPDDRSASRALRAPPDRVGR